MLPFHKNGTCIDYFGSYRLLTVLFLPTDHELECPQYIRSSGEMAAVINQQNFCMKILIIFFTALAPLVASAQPAGTAYYFKEVQWRIVLPSSFSITDSAVAKKYQDKGVALLEKSNDVKVGGLDEMKDLITANKNKFNYFNATIRRYNIAAEGDYTISSDSVKRMTYRSFQNLPNTELDSASSIQVIDKLPFNKFTIHIAINKRPYMTMVLLAKLYKGYDFGITYLYLDDKTKQEIENMLAQSVFTK